MEELYSSFAAAGADMVGAWPSQGYEHSESKVKHDHRLQGAVCLKHWQHSKEASHKCVKC